jgi:hypothetical protein
VKLEHCLLTTGAALALAALVCGCDSFQSETTVFGIEVTTIDSSTMLPTGRAGLIRHKNQLTKAGQSQQFYNAESDVNIWKGSLGNGYTAMSCQGAPDSASTDTSSTQTQASK